MNDTRALPERRTIDLGTFYEGQAKLADLPAYLARARELAGPDGPVLVTGSLYLLADLCRQTERVG